MHYIEKQISGEVEWWCGGEAPPWVYGYKIFVSPPQSPKTFIHNYATGQW